MQLKKLMIFVVRDPESVSDKVLNKVYETREFATKTELNYILLTSHPEVESRIPSGIDVVRADATMLKTLLRSTSGVMLLNEGTIVAKWSINNLPDFSTLKGDFRVKAETYSAQREVFPYILIVVFIVLIILSYRYLNK
jgi:hypothetical protein